jgi:hypothetical protein
VERENSESDSVSVKLARAWPPLQAACLGLGAYPWLLLAPDPC